MCLLALLFAPFAQAQDGSPHDDARPAVTIDNEALKRHGINPAFVVVARSADGGKRLLIAEHRPGEDSALHVLDNDGGYLHRIAVPSPQLVDFGVEADGRQALLVGSLGTRFYIADLERRTARQVLASLPGKAGFRALTPVSIVRGPEGPVVYGLFYKSDKESRDLGFARVEAETGATNVLSTLEWEKRFDTMISCIPRPGFQAALVIHQEPGKLDPKVTKPKRLTYVTRAGDAKELDGADEIFGAVWAPEGGFFVYVRRKGKVKQLMMRMLSSDTPIVIGEGAYFLPRFVGNRKIVVSTLQPEHEQALWTIDLPAGTPRRLDVPGKAAYYTVDTLGHAMAAWGPWGVSLFRFPGG